MFGIPAKLYDSDNLDWVPSLKLGYNTTSAHPECTMGRYERLTQRNTRKRPAPLDSEDSNLVDANAFDGMAVQTDYDISANQHVAG